MRVLSIVLIAALVGSAIGGAVGYVEVALDPDSADTPTDEATPPAAAQASSPRVEVAEPNFNFGQMERGREKSHEFLIRNVGNAPLTLRVGHTSCKCTLSEVKSGAIAPGETTHVRLEWSAKSDQGPFRQTATIITNDLRQPEITLSIDGEVVEASGVQPPDLAFDKVSVGEAKSAEVYVMAMVQDELTVSSAELTDPDTRDMFDVKIEPVEREKLPVKAARAGVRVTLTAKPGLPIGRFNQYLTLNTNLQDGEKLHIPVVGRVVGDISVHGARGTWLEEQGVLNLGRVQSAVGKKARLNLVVRGEGAESVKFEVGSVDPPELKITFGEPTRLKATLVRVPLEIEVPPGTRPMARLAASQGDEGKIVLKTTHPAMKQLSFGVRLSVER